MTTTEKGNKGEEMACIHLLELGYTILENNGGLEEMKLISLPEMKRLSASLK